MEIDSAPFWANILLYSYEEEYLSSLISSDKIKVRRFHSTKRFIDDLCTINDSGEFVRSICDIYPKELELRIEYRIDHAMFSRRKLLYISVLIKETPFSFLL